MSSILEKLGLSEKEAKVYLAALELAQDTVQNIAKKAGVNRPTAYFILERLMQLGLISTLDEGKKKLFVAENPKELENLLDEQKQEIENHKKELDENMNQLLAIYNAKLGKPVVKYFEGKDGLEAMDRYGRDKLHKGSEVLSISPIDMMEKQFPARRQDAVNERIQLGIKSRAIYTHADGDVLKARNKEMLRESIYVPREKLPVDASLVIYPGWGIKLFYYDVAKPYGVVIEDLGFTKNFTLIFELAWAGAKIQENK